MDIEYHTYIDVTDIPTMETVSTDIDIQWDGGDVDFENLTNN
jgi:hypothetical protein